MKILVACEFSGIVREAFTALGHEAWSCDLRPTEIPGNHYVGDVRDIIYEGWDLMIAHPPCTYLAVSGNRWMKDNPARERKQRQALNFVRFLLNAPIERIALEQPKSVVSGKICRPTQTIQPWQFGHGEVKQTNLWLKNLPPLSPARIVRGRVARVHREGPGPNREKNRSRTFPGIARAMAKQWGNL